MFFASSLWLLTWTDQKWAIFICFKNVISLVKKCFRLETFIYIIVVLLMLLLLLDYWVWWSSTQIWSLMTCRIQSRHRFQCQKDIFFLFPSHPLWVKPIPPAPFSQISQKRKKKCFHPLLPFATSWRQTAMTGCAHRWRWRGKKKKKKEQSFGCWMSSIKEKKWPHHPKLGDMQHAEKKNSEVSFHRGATLRQKRCSESWETMLHWRRNCPWWWQFNSVCDVTKGPRHHYHVAPHSLKQPGLFRKATFLTGSSSWSRKKRKKTEHAVFWRSTESFSFLVQ